MTRVKSSNPYRAPKVGQKRRAVEALANLAKKPKPTVKSLNRKIKKLQTSSEVKFKDASVGPSDISDTAYITTLFNTLQQGDTPSSREGAKVVCSSFQAGVAVQYKEGIAGHSVRCMVVQDKQHNAATTLTLMGAPTTASVLDNGETTDPSIAPYNPTTRQRYKILYDKVFTMNPHVAYTTSATGTPLITTLTDLSAFRRLIRFHVRKRVVTQYNTSNAGSGADIQSNAVWFVLASSAQASQSKTDEIDGYIRMYFKDG